MTGNTQTPSAPTQPSDTPDLTYLALGDSYTIGESVPESGRWPVQLLKEINSTSQYKFEAPRIIARTGWRTDQLKQAIQTENPPKDYDLVSLLIGVNNQYQGQPVENYVSAFEELLKIAIQQADGRKERVFVVSIPDYGYTPFGEGNREKISKEIDEYNAVNERISKEYGVRYYGITDISRRGLDDPSLVASDRLHPSERQYTLWVNRILSDPAFLQALRD